MNVVPIYILFTYIYMCYNTYNIESYVIKTSVFSVEEVVAVMSLQAIFIAYFL
jgi:hypothetical protein